MTEQEAFEAWYAGPHPEGWVASKFGEAERSLAKCTWHAALAWLRSQGEPVAWMYERDGMVHDGMYPPLFLQAQRPLDREDNWTETPLYLAPRAIENDDREYLSAIAHLGRAMKRLVIAARTSGGTAGPDAELMAACEQAEDAMSVGAIGRAMEAPQPAIPDGFVLVPKEPTPEMLNAAGPRPAKWNATPAGRMLREEGDKIRCEEWAQMIAAATRRAITRAAAAIGQEMGDE